MMKALSVRQPYADRIMNGTKLVEHRTWTTDFRGRIAIHAPAQVDWWEYAAQAKDAVYHSCVKHAHCNRGERTCEDCGVEFRRPRVLTSVVLGTVELYDIRDARAFDGGYEWLLRRARWLKRPIISKGAQGLWEFPRDLDHEIGILRS